VHIVIASIEKVIPTLEDAAACCACWRARRPARRCRSTPRFTPGRGAPDDPDGPREYHVVLLDNGRSPCSAPRSQDMLRCIRCGACMNHCPVYGAIGGHAYGWVYPGPIGAVLDAELIGVEKAAPAQRLDLLRPLRERLPGAHPAARLMRHWREQEFALRLAPKAMRTGLGIWSFIVRRRFSIER
jgi:L-lactate dehydrogenase complex protein LldF